MKQRRKFVDAGLLVLLSVLPGVAGAQSGGGSYRIEPVLVGAAGGTASGGGFTLHGSFGQAATRRLDAPGFRLVGGFWAAGEPEPNDVIFANGFEEGPTP